MTIHLERQNILVALQSGIIDVETAELLLDGLKEQTEDFDDAEEEDTE